MESHHKWNDYFRSHRNFILATLFEPDRVHAAAGDVLCEIDGKLLKVRTLVDQMEARGLSWRGYMEDMGNNPAREAATCAHPQLGTRDPTQSFEAPSASVPNGDGYATRHNPFMYFHSIIDSPSCNHRVVNLTKLTEDLAHERTTPNFAFITPNLCNDGHDGSDG